MPSTAITTFQDGIEGKLLTAVTTGTTTGITFKIKQINGATPTCPTAAFRLKVVQKTALNTKVEKWGVAAGTTQSGQTVTLGTVTRALSLTDGTSFSGSGTAQAFAAGADVFLAWDNQDASYTAKLDLVNAFTGANTFAGTSTFNAAVTVAGTTSFLKVPSLTTAQRTALTGANGMIVYDSDLAVLYQYIAGAWTTFASGSVVAAANNTAGKVDIASAAEISAGTATDASSGAINVIPVSQTVKTSSGAGDENKLPVLGSSGTLAKDFLATGTGTSAKYLRGDGTYQTLLYPVTLLSIAAASSTVVEASTTSDQLMDVNYSIASSVWAVGKAIHLRAGGLYTLNSGDLSLKVYLGSSLVGTVVLTEDGTSTSWAIDTWIVCRTTGASGVVQATTLVGGRMNNPAGTEAVSFTASDVNATSVPLNAAITLQIAAAFSGATANNKCSITNFIVSSHAVI